MAKPSETKNFRVDPELWEKLVDRMEKDHRRMSINSYANEILWNWVNRVYVDWEREKERLELQLRQEIMESGGKNVYAVGPVRAIAGKADEGKRKVAS